MDAATADAQSKERADVRALPVLGAVVFVILLGDILLWRAEPGVSLGLFALTLGGVCVALRPTSASWRTGAIGAVLIASCAQSAIEVSLSNSTAYRDRRRDKF
jgi:hypothetical protein